MRNLFMASLGSADGLRVCHSIVRASDPRTLAGLLDPWVIAELSRSAERFPVSGDDALTRLLNGLGFKSFDLAEFDSSRRGRDPEPSGVDRVVRAIIVGRALGDRSVVVAAAKRIEAVISDRDIDYIDAAVVSGYLSRIESVGIESVDASLAAAAKRLISAPPYQTIGVAALFRLKELARGEYVSEGIGVEFSINNKIEGARQVAFELRIQASASDGIMATSRSLESRSSGGNREKTHRIGRAYAVIASVHPSEYGYHVSASPGSITPLVNHVTTSSATRVVSQLMSWRLCVPRGRYVLLLFDTNLDEPLLAAKFFEL